MKTRKFEKVLIALDYDPTAQKVVESGYSLAKALNAEVILLHVISDPKRYSSSKHIRVMGFAGTKDKLPLKVESMDDLKTVAQQFLDNSKELLADKTIKTLLKEGESAEAIIKAAYDLHANIIVMGSYNQKSLQNIVIGSVSEKVLHYSSIPVFIIPAK